jgi:beta-galactosidase
MKSNLNPINLSRSCDHGLPNLENEFAATTWADIITPATALPIARYSKDYFAGQAAATINSFGKGRVVYLGTMGDAAFYAEVIRWLLEITQIQPLMDTPKSVEVMARWQGEKRLLFVINHNDHPIKLTLDCEYRELLTDKVVRGNLSIAAYEVIILSK